MANLTSKQLTELGDSFLSFAQSVGNYRMENRATLTRSQNQEIKELHHSLLDHADELFTTSAKLIMTEVRDSLDTIKKITGEIANDYNKLKKIQMAIDVAAAGVTLAAALFSKNPKEILTAVSGLVESWKKTEV